MLLVSTTYALDTNSNQTAINDDFDSIQKLIDEANPGQTIHLENKTYFGSGSSIKIYKNIVIEGDSSNTILDANSQSSIFVISPKVDVKLYGLTFINGYNSTEGGAIYNSGILTIDNSKFIDNYADGGAIHNAWKGKLTVSNSLFDMNNASFGAAIDNNEADLTIINTTFTNNACLEGGAIYNRFGEFLIYNCTFINNSAARGGGVYNNRGYMEIHDSRFISNNVYDLGGGIKSWGTCEVYDTIVQNNTAKQGGGIYVSEYTLLANNCFIENNNAEWGGGIYVEAKAKATVKNSKIINNGAVRGGGIDLNQGALDLTNCSVNNNTAETYGGGIYCSYLSSAIKNSEINNNAAKRGGAVYVNSQRNITVNITNVTIKNNMAQNGGAIFNRAEVNLVNVNLTSNRANESGGAIYNRKITSIENCQINNNEAPDNGGAVYNEYELNVNNASLNSNEAEFGGVIYNDGLAYVKNSILDSNRAKNGGAIYNTNNLFIESSKVNKNAATNYGGAIYNVYVLNVNNVSFNSNEARFGGVIYGNTSMNIKNSAFNSNKAFQAGVIYSKTNLTIDNSQFIENKVTHNAGVFYFSKGNVEIDNSIFKLNTGADEGGVIFNSMANVLVNNSQFISNEATSYGAAADNSGQLTIENSLFDNNTAYDAAVIDNDGILTISKSKFINNVAKTNGGVVDSKKPITITSSIFENNCAVCGGAIYRGNAVGCLFVNCHAENGGAIYLGNATDCLFVNCSANDHAAVICEGVASDSYCVNCHDAYDEITYPEAWSDENYNDGNYAFKSDSPFIYGYAATFSKNPSQVLVVSELASDATGNIKFTIKGATIKVKIKDGKAKAYFHDLSTGTYPVDVQYEGDSVYPSDSISLFIKVDANYAITSLSSHDVGYGQDAVIKIEVDENAPGNLDVSVNGVVQKVKITSKSLNTSFTGLKMGSYNVTVTYSGSGKYVPQNMTSTFNVVKGTPISSVNVSNPVGFGDDAIINVNMLNNQINGNVWFTVSDENKTKILTDKFSIVNGVASRSIPGLGLGKYYLHIYYAGNAHYNAQTIKTSFDVVKKTPISSVDVSNCAPGDNAIIKVKVNGVNGNIWFTISDANRTKILTNSCRINDGWAIISIPGLSVGKYYVHIYYAGNVHYSAQTIKTSFDVAKISPGLSVAKTTVEGKTVLTASIAKDARGNVNFAVNGNTYKAPIVKGIATVTLPDLAPGTYTLKSSYGGNYKYLAETKMRTITIK
ncbi:hypothetical protein TL18_03600 [Methanobrevibacter sp. YE315]|uniref:right-handed parallel beta-helix repeat-containing protein n=1 Tax=Methanobrevibacter sp. YE315 TaxID=1609968 RepID=UPI000764EAD1|nr:Ig-like domain repeat protein [Methanobrevibacter sp. YE315]AMD17185.1 hypothetical protein TL18_03600 [Methanobrevibacter sp. YE315]